LESVLETIEILSDPDATRLLQEGLEAARAGQLLTQEEVERELLG
jgi:hypothetical protein